MNKKIIYIIVGVLALAAIGFGVWQMYGKANPALPEGQIELNDDTTQSIDEAIQDITIDDVDSEFMDIDKAIEGL